MAPVACRAEVQRFPVRHVSLLPAAEKGATVASPTYCARRLRGEAKKSCPCSAGDPPPGLDARSFERAEQAESALQGQDSRSHQPGRWCLSRKGVAAPALAPLLLVVQSSSGSHLTAGCNRRAAAATEGAGLSCGASGHAVTSYRVIRRAPIRSGSTIQMTSVPWGVRACRSSDSDRFPPVSRITS